MSLEICPGQVPGRTAAAWAEPSRVGAARRNGIRRWVGIPIRRQASHPTGRVAG